MKKLSRTLLLLAAVVALGAFAAQGGTISVAWDAAGDAAGYRVYYGTSPGSYTQHKDVPGATSTSTTLTGLDGCTRYYIAVKAYDAGGLESEGYSNEVAGLPRPIVSSVTPSSGEQGATMTLTVAGESFDTGASVTLGSGITIQAVRRDSCTQLSVDVQIDASAATGGRTAEVINPDNSFGALGNAFTVVANAAPTVSSASPAAGASDVSLDVRPQVVFSEQMDAGSISSSTVQLRDASGSAVAQASGSPSLAADGRTVTVTPAADLEGSSSHYLWVRGGILGVKDTSGKALASSWTQSPAWTTGTAPDTEGPSVTSTSPSAGASDVDVDVTPQVTFDEALAGASVSASTVRLIDASGAAVSQASGSPQLSADGKTVTITPASPLDENAGYRIRVIGGSGGVKDLAGNAMDSTWTQPSPFETENLPPGMVSNVRRTDVK